MGVLIFSHQIISSRHPKYAKWADPHIGQHDVTGKRNTLLTYAQVRGRAPVVTASALFQRDPPKLQHPRGKF